MDFTLSKEHQMLQTLFRDFAEQEVDVYKRQALGMITLNGASIKNCQAAQGGGINAAGAATINNSTLTGNKATAGNGGGAYASGAVLISGSTISQNTATGDGGGIYSAGNFTFSSGTVSGNSAERGGGIYTPAPNAFLNLSLIHI